MNSMFSPFQQSALRAMGYTLYVERSAQTVTLTANDVAPVSNPAPVATTSNAPHWVGKLARYFSQEHIQELQLQSLPPNVVKAKREVWQKLRKVLRTQ